MMNRKRIALALLILLVGVSVTTLAQRFGGRTGGDYDDPRAYQRTEITPMWTNAPAFKKDVFTFVRLKYGSWSGFSRGRGGGWATDYPDADLNFAWRLQQMTSLKVDPNGKVLEIVDPELLNHPWCYMVEPGRLRFSDEDVAALRKYLLNGGFMMVDDFWGDGEWENFYTEMKRVFPQREPIELNMKHPIFHTVFDIKLAKKDMQVPNVRTGTEHQWTGVTHERGEDGRDVHFKGFFDDKNRMMVFIAHNTDNGDGWEREGENHYYFKEFAEKKAYPLGINVVFYAMTH